jgi:hypothetical protein
LGRVGSGSGRTGSGRINLYVVFFFRSLIDFNWIKGHLISGRVRSNRVRVGSDQFDFLKKMDWIRFGSGSCPDGSDGFLGSDRILPPLGIRQP